MLKCVLSTVCGLALMVAPGALDYDDDVASLFYVIGPLIVSFSVIAIWEVVRGARFFNVPLAAVLVIGAPMLTLEPLPIATALIAGPASALLSLLPNDTRGSYGGGWRSLMP